MDFPSIADFVKAVADKQMLIDAAIVSQRPAQQGIGASLINTNQQSTNVVENKTEHAPNKFASGTILEKTKATGFPILPAMITQLPPVFNGALAGASTGSSTNIASAAAKGEILETEIEKTSDEKSKGY